MRNIQVLRFRIYIEKDYAQDNWHETGYLFVSASHLKDHLWVLQDPTIFQDVRTNGMDHPATHGASAAGGPIRRPRTDPGLHVNLSEIRLWFPFPTT